MRTGYLPQDTGLMREQTIRQYFKSMADLLLEHSVIATMAGLGLKNISLDRGLSSLSSGQKTKVGLARLLLEEPDLLLLDEPTNNLDIPALIWLEEYLKKSSVACVIVSHDRKFLDRVTDRVFELNKETHSLRVENGKYTEYLERKLKAIERQKEMYENQQEEMKRLMLEARKKREKEIKGGNKKPTDNDKFLKGFKSDRAGKKLTSTAKILEEKVERMEKIERVVEGSPLRIDLEAEYAGGQADIVLKDVEIKYKNGFALGPISLQINYGKRFGFIGLNGSGKTTLLKIISGESQADSGIVEIGSAVRAGNLTQEHSDLPSDATVFDFFSSKSGIDQNFVYNALIKFGLSEKNIRGKIGELSPGTKARFLLSLFAVRSVNTLILDEPTNHLDIEAVSALEQVVADYGGTIITVSHDRYFLEKSKLDFVYLLEDGKAKSIPDFKKYVESVEKNTAKLLKSYK